MLLLTLHCALVWAGLAGGVIVGASIAAVVVVLLLLTVCIYVGFFRKAKVKEVEMQLIASQDLSAQAAQGKGISCFLSISFFIYDGRVLEWIKFCSVTYFTDSFTVWLNTYASMRRFLQSYSYCSDLQLMWSFYFPSWM